MESQETHSNRSTLSVLKKILQVSPVPEVTEVLISKEILSLLPNGSFLGINWMFINQVTNTTFQVLNSNYSFPPHHDQTSIINIFISFNETLWSMSTLRLIF